MQLPNTGPGQLSNPVSQGELQKTFIAMLFAFAVSVVALQISEFLIVITNNWRYAVWPGELYTYIRPKFWELFAVATHSFLSLLMLSVSWVMWSKSQAAGHLEDIKEIFSIKFITFLLEVLLVTIYFSLSKSVEGDFANYSKDKTLSGYLTPISARPEAIQMFWIFAIFALWDSIVDVLRSPKTVNPIGFFNKVGSATTGIATYCAISILCGMGALGVYYAMPESEVPAQAIAGDIALVMLLLLFNRAKAWEHYLFKIFPTERTRNNSKRLPTLKGNILIFSLLAVFAVCIYAIRFAIPCYQR